MPGWPQYMIDGIQKHCTSGMAITTLDQERWARTPGFKLKHSEVESIVKAIRNIPIPGYWKTVTVQGKKYSILEKNGGILNAVGPVNGRSENVLWAAITGDTVIVAKAPKDRDKGQCKAEVLTVVEHLREH